MPLPGPRAMVHVAMMLALISLGDAAQTQVMRAPGYYLPPQTPRTAAKTHASSSSSHGGNLLDLNTASVGQLSSLPGMGAVYARRVVAGRPYHAKNQLVRRGILPAAEYARISGLIVAHRATASAAGGNNSQQR